MRRIRLNRSILTVNDMPVFPRMIQYQGEPLELLRKLGFNAVWLGERPPPAMLEDAKRLGLGLVCPPPYDPQSRPAGDLDAPLPLIGPEYDAVLAWDLGRGLSERELTATRHWADQIRMADRRQPGRPLMCMPSAEMRGYSRAADVLLLGHSVLGTSLELNDYGTWLRQQPQLARPGSLIWTTLETQPAPSLRQQWAAIGQGRIPATFPAESIQLLAATAISAGSRGLLFESFSSLAATDYDTRLRALALELVNLQLTIVEPWIAEGAAEITIPGSQQPGSPPSVWASVIRAEHSRLLLATSAPAGAQFAAGQSAATGLTFVVLGVPESHKAYLVMPGGLRPLPCERRTGGVRITLDEFDLTAMVVITESPQIIERMGQRVVPASRRWTELERGIGRC